MPARKKPAARAPISTLPEYVAAVVQISRKFRRAGDQSDGPWFRGANNSKHGLLPGAYWRQNIDESALVVEFCAQAPPLLVAPATAPGNTWEWYFLMQHYGLPTRLLDWTENALFALYFALSREGPAPCVWALDPAQMNLATTGDARVITPGGEFTKYWLPFESGDQPAGCHLGAPDMFTHAGNDYDNSAPLAIFAPRRNPRILAQHGTFTVFGADKTPLDRRFPAGTSCLARIDVRPKSRDRLLGQLELCGVTELRLFPQLDKLAPHIKRRLGILP